MVVAHRWQLLIKRLGWRVDYWWYRGLAVA